MKLNWFKSKKPSDWLLQMSLLERYLQYLYNEKKIRSGSQKMIKLK